MSHEPPRVKLSNVKIERLIHSRECAACVSHDNKTNRVWKGDKGERRRKLGQKNHITPLGQNSKVTSQIACKTT